MDISWIVVAIDHDGIYLENKDAVTALWENETEWDLTRRGTRVGLVSLDHHHPAEAFP